MYGQKVDTTNFQPEDYYFRALDKNAKTYLFTPREYHDRMNVNYSGEFTVNGVPPEFEKVSNGIYRFTQEGDWEDGEKILRMEGYLLHNFIGREREGHIRG